MDRETRYAVLRDLVQRAVSAEAGAQGRSADERERDKVEAAAIADLVFSVVEAVHVIAEAQREQAMNFAS